jgi:uncharacterized membrane protein YidH (DUF202 family)
MGSKRASVVGALLILFGVVAIIGCLAAYSQGERYWNYGPNDPMTTILPFLRPVAGIFGVVLIWMGIRVNRATKIK